MKLVENKNYLYYDSKKNRKYTFEASIFETKPQSLLHPQECEIVVTTAYVQVFSKSGNKVKEILIPPHKATRYFDDIFG